MAVAAETIMEARIVRLESDVGHLREDVADVKQDVRALHSKLDAVDQRLNDKIDSLDQRLTGRIDALKVIFHSTRIWALLLYIALAGAMLGTMARGFGWV
jgi:hypothetical protein